MFGPYDDMFDFNKDGELDAWEKIAAFKFMEEMSEDDDEIDDDDDEYEDDDDYEEDEEDE